MLLKFKTLIFFITIALSITLCFGQKKTNVVIIVADDLGSTDLHVYGATDLTTPNLDLLANQGVLLDRFYVDSPVCTPSRAALLTGRTGTRTGVLTNKNPLPSKEVTIAELFKKEQYNTALFGKWHLGMNKDELPNNQGFDEFIGHLGGTIENYLHNSLKKGSAHDLWHNQDLVYEDSTHFGEIVVRETNRFIELNQENPFLVFVSFNNPHYPIQPLAKFYNLFDGLEEPRRSYAAYVAQLDDEVGRIINKIDELGIRENTLIVFLSDHGHSIEERNQLFNTNLSENGPFGGGQSAPFRGNKFLLLEGGVRVPAILSLPERIPKGVVRKQIISSLDLLPTILNFAEIELPSHNLDGNDISDVLIKNALSSKKYLFWRYKEKWAITENKWKVLGNNNESKLFHLLSDPEETTDLSSDYPKILDCLTEIFNKHENETMLDLPRTNNINSCNDSIEIYPNPVGDSFTINTPKFNIEYYQISIIDIKGNLVNHTKELIDQRTVKISVISESKIYFVIVKNESLTKSFKMIQN